MIQIQRPKQGKQISWDASNSKWLISDQPIICFIEGDGIGQDITPVVRKVLDAAVSKAYGDKRRIHWLELYAGEKAVQVYGEGVYLPKETLAALEEYKIGLKGPLTTPVGGGMRSLNVAIRKHLDLYTIIRPVRFFQGCRSPLKHPEKTDMVIFREATEDVYAGIEWESNTANAIKVMDFLEKEMSIDHFQNREYGLGIKYISRHGTERIMRRAIEYAFMHDRESITLVHKGNIMKYTEGAFRNWCYQIAQKEYGAQEKDGQMKICKQGKEVIIKDVIADNFLQQILLKPEEYSLILTMNLNGDYISDALAAQVGGLGFAPGANIGERCAVFEATHGTAPRVAGLDKANPSSLLLSGEMMLRQMFWVEAADLILSSIEKTLGEKTFTYDLTKGTQLRPVSTSAYGEALIGNL